MEAVSWLRDTGGTAVSRQERAAGARSEAASWLASKAASELERTASPAEGSAVAAAATTSELKGNLDGERISERDGVSAEGDVGETPTKGDEKQRAEEEGPTTRGSTAVGGSPRADRASSTTITDGVRAGETGETGEDAVVVQRSPRNDEGATEHLSGDNATATATATAVSSGTDAPPPPRASTLAESEPETDLTAAAAAATATAAADAAGDFEHPVGRTASTDRTAPAPWLEPTTTPLARGGSFAPTAAGAEDFGRMLDAGEAEWSRVSLSRTPPFDALNSPSLPLRYAPVRGRPRPLPRSNSEGLGAEVPFAADGENGPGSVAAGTTSNPDGPKWIDFFAPPNQMAPKGDAYRGSGDGFRSADASASTTVRADSAGSFVGPGPARRCEGGGTDDDRCWSRARRRRCSGGGGAASEESWGASLGEVHSPVGEAQSRIMGRAAGGGGGDGRGGRWEETSEGFPSSSSRSVRAKGEGSSRKRWHKQAEQSRQYMRRWEAFLGRAHRHFDGEVSQACPEERVHSHLP